MKEHLGQPHFEEFEEIEPKKTVEGLTFTCSAGFLDFGEASTTLGDKYDVVLRPDGTLTVKEKDESK